MLPANKTSQPLNDSGDAALYQRCFERERRARQQAEAVLEAKSLDLYLKHEELRRINATLEQRIEERTAELAEAVKLAENANIAKGEFLAKMSHEIRTPMNGVLGMLEALRVTQLDGKQQEYLKVAHESAETLLGLINDILDFSKIEAGRMSMEQINFDLHQVLNNVFQLWRPRALEKNLDLTLTVDPEAHRWLIGDPTRVMQIMSNLVSNALKFTDKGSITIQCDALTPEGIDPTMLRFIVQDTGVGMSEQVCKRLFTAFEQAHGAATSRVYGGTGLGLAICKQLAQLMQGEISVESTPGAGSCFIVVLPFIIGTQPTMQASPIIRSANADKGTQHRLLVVDDNETNRRVALAVLEHLGFETSFACDGAEAVSAVKNGNYSLVLMDCHMPVMDGMEAAQAIREWEKEAGRQALPIIAVSASAFQEDRDRCAAAGMNAFIPKPVTLSSVQTALQEWLPVTASTMQQTQSGNTDMTETSNAASFPDHLLDHEQFMEMKTVTGDQFAMLFDKFCSDAKLQIAGMRDAVRDNNTEALRKCAHKLKGGSATIGAKILSRICHRMEERARDGHIDGADEGIDAINGCLDEVIAAVASLTANDLS
jgi:signal transduction histidine kinase/DNA-binding response OmpR family regulator